MGKFQIVGVFWQQLWVEFPDLRRLVPFIGVIDIDENGSFLGKTEDIYGKSEIVGELNGKLLEFRKRYYEESPGDGLRTVVKKEIRYVLLGALSPAYREIVCGGWKGSYQYVSNGKKFDGQVTCSIHPLE